MIKFLVQVKDNYDYSIIQLDLLLVTTAQNMISSTSSASVTPIQPYYVVDRASYDAHAAAMKAANGSGRHSYYGSRMWKVPTLYRGRHVTIDPAAVYDTRADAATAALKLVEDKVREDIVKKKKKIVQLENEVTELSGKKLTPKAKFQNCSTLNLKKKKKSP